MKQNSCDWKPSSFAETVQRVENYVKAEIVQESIEKQLCYHTIDHAVSVKRRANKIFESIKPVLAADLATAELKRLKSLMDLSAISHDMVQEFICPTNPSQPRQRVVGESETATVNKLIEYLEQLDRELATKVEPDMLFSQQDKDILADAILATVCDRDPQAGKASYSFSNYSIYQPYLYNTQPKISPIGSILALADLGALAMDGMEPYIQDGIAIFLEDNPNFPSFSHNGDNLSDSERELAKTKLIKMAQFMVNFARERYARLDLELAGFDPEMRQILKDSVLIHLNPNTIEQISNLVPTDTDTSLLTLVDFFSLKIEKNVK